MKYLKKYSSEESFNNEFSSLQAPAVALTEYDNKIWYVRETVGYIRAIIETDYDEQETFLYNNVNMGYTMTDFNSSTSPIKVEIDGVDYAIDKNEMGFYHTFETAGRHEVKYYYDADAYALNAIFMDENSDGIPVVELDFSAFNPKNITDLSYLFTGMRCDKLTNITFGGLFDTKNVKYFDNITGSIDLNRFEINYSMMKNFDFSSALNKRSIFKYQLDYHYAEKSTVNNCMKENDVNAQFIKNNEIPYGYLNNSRVKPSNIPYAILEIDGQVVYYETDITPGTKFDFSQYYSEWDNFSVRWIVKMDDSVKTVVAKNNMALTAQITEVMPNGYWGDYGSCANSGYYYTYIAYNNGGYPAFESIVFGSNGCDMLWSEEGVEHRPSPYYYKNMSGGKYQTNFNIDSIRWSHGVVYLYNTNSEVTGNVTMVYAENCGDTEHVTVGVTGRIGNSWGNYSNAALR